MALTSTAAVRAGNGLGGQTHIAAVATGTISVADACTAAAEAGFTVAAVEVQQTAITSQSKVQAQCQQSQV